MQFQDKIYDQDTDSVFLLYTAIDDSLNKNGWRVTTNSIDNNISSGLNKPLVLKRKDPLRPQDLKQKGDYIHPHPEIADYFEQLKYQENYAIGRAVKFDKDANNKWRVWFNITDPQAKTLFKAASVQLEYPQHISPLIATFPIEYPDEDLANSFDHWSITHWAFVDQPAYADLLKLRGKCNGTLAQCEIKLKNASENNNCGFCVKGELTRLIGASDSSLGNNSTIQDQMEDSKPSTQTGSFEKLTSADGKPLTITNPHSAAPIQTSTIIENSSKQEQEPATDTKPGMPKGDINKDKPVNQEEEKEAELLKGLKPEVLSYISTLRAEARTKESAYNTILKEVADVKGEFEKIKIQGRRYQLKSIIPRYNFKTDEAHEKEIDKVMQWQGISDEEIASIYENALIASTTKISNKGAAITQRNYDVPNFNNVKQQEASQENSSDRLSKLMSLVTMLNNNNGGDL